MFTLDQIVPWGRSYDEYCRMFALTDEDMRVAIVDCGSGPAGFNAGATRRGARVVSCDPLYCWGTKQIEERIASTRDTILEEARRNSAEFVWHSIRSVDELGAVRTAAMKEFLDDYESLSSICDS